MDYIKPKNWFIKPKNWLIIKEKNGSTATEWFGNLYERNYENTI